VHESADLWNGGRLKSSGFSEAVRAGDETAPSDAGARPSEPQHADAEEHGAW